MHLRASFRLDASLTLPSTDQARADFRLQSGRPALAIAGRDLTPKSDLVSFLRPTGAAADRGAYEHPRL